MGAPGTSGRSATDSPAENRPSAAIRWTIHAVYGYKFDWRSAGSNRRLWFGRSNRVSARLFGTVVAVHATSEPAIAGASARGRREQRWKAVRTAGGEVDSEGLDRAAIPDPKILLRPNSLVAGPVTGSGVFPSSRLSSTGGAQSLRVGTPGRRATHPCPSKQPRNEFWDRGYPSAAIPSPRRVTGRPTSSALVITPTSSASSMRAGARPPSGVRASTTPYFGPSRS